MANDLTIISTIPYINQTDAPLDATIQIVTNVQIHLPSLTTNNIGVEDSDGGEVTGALSYSNHINGSYGIITFSPATRLKPVTNYNIVLSTSLLGINGEVFGSPVAIPFTTEVLSAKTLITSDGITFAQNACYPTEASGLASWFQYDGGSIIESRIRQRKTQAWTGSGGTFDFGDIVGGGSGGGDSPVI